ncbi:MAG: TonB-dependent receptor plug domain-containing protein [Bacteroidetes bacterium]|nr:TonB-dependent receptor plug domain-containing protein [Bacteroidota bacterium]
MKKSIILSLLLFQVIQSFSQSDSTDKQVNLNEVVIAESKFESLKSNTAQQSHVISSKDLQRLNAQKTSDVLMASGAAFVQMSQQGGGSVVLRGFEASRVLMVIDGVRMNNILYRSGHLQNIITVDNNILDRIEVLYGPSSTVYGSDALGGVVHMRTKNPLLAGDKKFLTAGNAMFRFGSVNNELTGHADISLGCKKFASLTSATFSRFGDLRMGNYVTNETASLWTRDYYQARTNVYDSIGKVTGQKDTAILNKANNVQAGSGYYQYDILQKFLFQQSENISHVLNVHFSNSSNVPRYDRLAVTSASTILKDAEWYYGPQQRLLAIYDFNWKNAGALDLISVGLNYQNIVESRNNRSFNGTFRTERTEKVNIVGVHADFRKKIKTHTLNFGLEGQFNMLKSSAVARNIKVDTTKAASSRYPDGKNNMNYVALYLTHNWVISPKVILSDGIRYNLVTMHSTLTSESEDFFPLPYNELKNTHHALSGNLGLVALPGRGFRIAALFSTGFRAPNVDDMSKIFESAPGLVVVPNSKLKPEYTLNGELTLEKTFASRYRISATGFYTYFQNAITADIGTFNGKNTVTYDGTLSNVITLVNKNKAYIAGVTATAEADVTDWLSVYASVTYTYGRILTDTTPYPLDHIAPIYGRAGFRAKYKWVRGEFFSVFNGKKKEKDYNMLGEDNFGQGTGTDMPCWFTLNARIGFQPIKHFGFDLGCDNLMDLRYRHFASGISAPGRNFFVTARVNW